MIRSFILLTLFPTVFLASAQFGQLDLDFSADGMQITAAAEYSSTAYDVAQLPNGYLLVAGDARVSSSGGAGIAVVKYVPDGELDASFGTNGITHMVTGTGTAQQTRRMALLPDGSILLAGSSQQTPATQLKVLLAKLHPDGTPDHLFATAGISHVAVGEHWTTTKDMAVQPDGKILVTGSFTEGGSTLFLARVVANGGWGNDPLDPEFGGGLGYVTLHTGSGVRGESVALDAAGNIHVFGIAFTPSAKLILTRYLPDGTLDSSFGTDGLVLLDHAISNSSGGTMIMHEGKYFVCARTSTDLVVSRLNADGSLDATWGTGGTVLLDGSNWSATNTSGLSGLAVQADGKLLVGNGRPAAAGGGALLARLNSDGTIDTSFGDDGLVVTETGQQFNRVILQQDQRIVAVGRALDPSVKFFTARYHSGIHTGMADPATPAVQASLIPNPVFDDCELAIVLENSDRLSAVVYDAQGRAVLNPFNNELFAGGTQRRTMDLSDLAPGAYMVALRNSTGRVFNTRLIKQ